MEEENVVEEVIEEGKKRIRRKGAELRQAKIAVLEEKIAKKEADLEALKEELEELKRPPQFSDRERQAFFRKKVEEGILTLDEAYQLGYRG